MSTDYTKKRNLKYLNRDFDSLKSDFIEHLKIYFGNTNEDFNTSSVGMMLAEMGAFFSDNLNFYLDRKFEESFVHSAKQKKNIFKHAKQLGFKAFGKSCSTGKIDAFIEVPATKLNEKIQPDIRYMGTVKRGAQIKNSSGIIYEILEDIDFSKVDINDINHTKVSNTDPNTKEPTSFALRVENVAIKSGETKTTTFTVTAYKSFLKLTLPDDDVIEMLSVKDSDGNDWYEVDYLAQDTIYLSEKNSGADAANVPYILKLKSVPRRFVTEYDIENNRMSFIFGTGDGDFFDGELIPDIGDLALPLYGKDSFTDFVIDPQNYLKTRTLGLAPTNTTLTVQYRVGGGTKSNCGANDITSVSNSSYEVADSSLSSTTVSSIANSFSVTNPKPITGGKDESTIEEIRELISSNFAAQARCVSEEDFLVRSLSMPTRFGSVFRAGVQVNPLNKNAVELVVLSKDNNGYVCVAYDELKNNLKKYLNRYRMLTQGIEILDGKVINIGINFGIMTSGGENKTEVLSNCLQTLKDYFNVDKWQFGQPINISDIYKTLSDVNGVVSIIDIKVVNRIGTYDGRTYSNYSYNIQNNTRNNMIYLDTNCFWEIKYKNIDIQGYAK